MSSDLRCTLRNLTAADLYRGGRSLLFHTAPDPALAAAQSEEN